MILIKITFKQSRFSCKICKDEVEINIHDETSYISKAPHDTFFGMELSTYRVKHKKNNEFHINSIIIDQKGLFRGHLDAYVEIIEGNTNNTLNIHILEDEITDKSIFTLFYMVDKNMGNVLVFENIETIDSLVFIEKVQKKIEEAREIYVNKNYFIFSIADLEVDVILYNEMYLIFQLIKISNHDISKIIDHYITVDVESLNLDTFLLGIRMLGFIISNIKDDIDTESMLLLISNPLIFSNIEIKYPNKMLRIVNRLGQNFKLPEKMLIHLFQGEYTISQLVLNFPDDYVEIVRMIDYINRRHLLE